MPVCKRTTNDKINAVVSNEWIEHLERMTDRRLSEHSRKYLSYVEGKTLECSITDGLAK